MKRRQCKCVGWWHNRLTGEVINVTNTYSPLPGLGNQIYPIRLYTVECSRCGHRWHYRKKRKK